MTVSRQRKINRQLSSRTFNTFLAQIYPGEASQLWSELLRTSRGAVESYRKLASFASTMSRDPYRVLGVPYDARQEDIRSAYLRLAKRHHPDLNKTCGNADQFKAINFAWETLGNKSKRAMYDASVGDMSSFRTRARQGPASASSARGRSWGPSYGSPRGTPPILRVWGTVTHPKTLLWVVPIAIVGFLTFGATEKEETIPLQKVRAWYNPVTMRWETPAPWDPHFRKYEHLVQKVDKNLVHVRESTRRS